MGDELLLPSALSSRSVGTSWRSLFLSDSEKTAIMRWENTRNDSTFSAIVLGPLFRRIARIVPPSVSPNVLSLSGALFQLYGFYVTYYLPVAESYRQPDASGLSELSFASLLLILIFQIFANIDGIHAHATRTTSALTHLFHVICVAAAVVPLALTLASVVGLTSIEARWLCVHLTEMLLVRQAVRFLHDGVLRSSFLTGPTEVLSCVLAYAGIRHLPLPQMYTPTEALLVQALLALYACVLVPTVFAIATLPARRSATRLGAFLALLVLHVPPTLYLAGITPYPDGNVPLMAAGAVAGVLVVDLTLCGMGDRDIHPLVVLLMALAFLSPFAALVLCVLYCSAVVADLAEHMHLPVLTPVVNVYVNGVYDLCHLGHMRLFQRALVAGGSGARLVVGVHSDEAVAAYKRPPIQTLSERVATVSACRGVAAVIPSAPLVTTRAFMREHGLHKICISTEYDTPTDHYYAEPRADGVVIVLPRTTGVSTSDYIARIARRIKEDGEIRNKQAEEGLSASVSPIKPAVLPAGHAL